MSSYANKFLEYEFGAKEPLDLGYIQTRLCMGSKGFKRISYIALIKSVGDGGLADEILQRLRHSVLAIIHALHKQNLVTDIDLPLTLKSKKYDDLVYHYDNVLVKLEKYKKVYDNLHYNFELLQNNNTNLIMENDNLQQENQHLKEAINQTAYERY